jgi:hypothetical protein
MGEDSGSEGKPGQRVSVGVQRQSARRWTEVTFSILEQSHVADRNGPLRGVILEVDDALYWLTESDVKPIGMTGTELQDRLRWLYFDIVGAGAQVDAPTQGISIALDGLKLALGSTIPDTVCPDQLSWAIPWTLVMDGEPIMALSPQFAFENFGIDKGAPSEIWVGSDTGLPHVREELDQFLAHFPNARVVTSAKEARQSSGRREVLHIVGHARHNANPMFSHLEFSDGPLYAAEIARLPLRARLAVLMACETGRVGFHVSGEPSGLARSFLALGTQAVIGSQWPLDDEAAQRFSRTLYSNLISGGNLVESVAQARKHCRDWREHPYYWGAPIVFCGLERAS